MTRHRVWVLAASFGALTAVVGGQEPRGAATSPLGTARLGGRVVDHAGAPVRRALVNLAGSGLARNRTAITSDAGAFGFYELPPGQFTLTASRAAYITTAYGAKGPGRPGTPIRLSAGQSATDLSITLARGAVIEGRITDLNGDPLAGIPVAVMLQRPQNPAVRVYTPPEDEIVTDDRGMYRAFGLEAGSYVVGAAMRFGANQVTALSSAQIDTALQDLQRRNTTAGSTTATSGPPPTSQTFTFAPVMYPGTANAAEVQLIVVQAGEERAGVDLVLRPFRAARISGTVTSPGEPEPVLSISLEPVVRSPMPRFIGAEPQLLVPPRGNGAFTYGGVPPGTYALTAVSPGGTLWARTQVTVSGDDISGVSLQLQPTPTVSGRIVSATASAPPALGTSRLRLMPPGAGGDSIVVSGLRPGIMDAPAATVSANRSFVFGSVIPGTYAFELTAPLPAGWWLRSAVTDGKDVLDTGLDVTRHVADLIVTFSDRHSELTGTLQTPAGTPATDYFVVVFTTDRALWRPSARRLVFTRPATDGGFSVRDLPAGDYYVAALTDLDPNDWKTPDFLAPLVPASVQVTIVDGERKVQNLRISR